MEFVAPAHSFAEKRRNPSLAHCRGLMATTALALFCTATALQAQSASGSPEAFAGPDVGAATYDFNIPAQSLASALSAFSRQTGLQVSWPAGIGRDATSTAVVGRYSAEQALQFLRQDSGIRFHLTDDNAAVLHMFASAADSSQSSNDTILLDTITLTADRNGTQAQDVFTASKSSVYISPETLDRFGHRTVGDMLKGQPGVQVGDSRNGGGLDVNIRGLQGQNRIAVTVDGTQQALDAYRGYAGTQQRTYIDPDLISDVVIEKGPSAAAGAPGGIGGTVAMQTIGVDDILKDGQTFGIRLKGEISDNGIAPQGPRSNVDPIYKYAVEPRTDRENILDSDARSGSLAFAFTSDHFDLVGAYAKRQEGNYFAGTHGHDRYRRFRTLPTLTGTIDVDLPTVASTYFKGEEVMNTSSNTESVLLKATIRPTDDQTIDIGYRHFNGRFGEIMPTALFRRGGSFFRPGKTINQWPLSSMKIDSLNARYAFDSVDNDLIDFTANAWMTDADSEQLNGVNLPQSQTAGLDGDYGWVRQNNRRWGVDASNRAQFDTRLGQATLDLGLSYMNETIRPADDVVITEDDRRRHRVLRDGERQEASVSAYLTLEPTDALSVRMGGRYVRFDSQDNNNRRNSEEKLQRSGGGFTPSFGISYNLTENSLVYVNYTEAYRMPGLFESTTGTYGVVQSGSLKPEKSRSWEIGASTVKSDLFAAGDTSRFKVAYFNTNIKDFITRYYTPDSSNLMKIRNADSYKVSGLELQANYDGDRFFADLSATHYFNTESCDAEAAGWLRAAANYDLHTENTPDCTPGAFSGSYANTQNPPEYAVNLTAGLRLFEEKLTVGGRMTYTSGPTEKLDKPWHKSRTTEQLYYHPVTVFDAFLTYKLREDAVLNASVENITGRYYLDPLAQSNMPAPGRTVRASLTMKF